MDRKQSRGRPAFRRLATGGAFTLVGLLTSGTAARAEWRAPTAVAGPDDAASRSSWSEALLRTKAEGIPTILVVTSRAVPASSLTARNLVSTATRERFRGVVQLAELCVEDEPEQARNLMVTKFPTIVGLKVGAGGKFVIVGSRAGVMSADELVGWVEGLGLGDSSNKPYTNDPFVMRTGLFHGSSPQASPSASPQYPTPPPPVKMVPVQPPPPPPPPPAPVVEREVVVEEPVEREVIIEREVVAEPAPPTREVVREIVVEAAPEPPPTTREVVREIVVQRAPAPAQPRAVTPAPRNVLTRSAPVRERQIIVQRSAAPTRTVTTRAAAPAPTQVIQVVREVAPAPTQTIQVVREVAPAPTQVVQMVREVAPAPTQVVQMVRDVTPAAAPLTGAVGLSGQRAVNLIRPGLFGRALGGVGNRLRVAALPRIDVTEQRETRYVPLAPQDRAVYLSDTAAPQTYAIEAEPAYPEERHRRHVCGSHCPHNDAPAQPPAQAPQPYYYPVPVPTPAYTPPYAPSPQSR